MTTTEELQQSIDDRVELLRGQLGEPFREDPRLGSYAIALEATDASRTGQTSKPRRPFLERADELLAAHEVALSLLEDVHPHGFDRLATRASMLFAVETIGRGHVHTVKQLKYLETAFFTFWYEADAARTREFWARVAEMGLSYKRRDLMAEIFEAGHIATREHYEFAVDMLNEPGVDSARLAALIATYERE